MLLDFSDLYSVGLQVTGENNILPLPRFPDSAFTEAACRRSILLVLILFFNVVAVAVVCSMDEMISLFATPDLLPAKALVLTTIFLIYNEVVRCSFPKGEPIMG